MHGGSILKRVRCVYKPLQLMEDGMVIGRLARSHLRYKALVDVSGLEKKEADARVPELKLHALKGGAFRQGVSLRLCPLTPA
jgi:hypothetical protein